MGTQLAARGGRERRRAAAKRERELAKLAARQHGVLSRRQLVASGLGPRTIGIVVHEGGIRPEERTAVAGIPVTSVARTLFDLAEVFDERQLERAFEEADRLGLLKMRAVEEVCARGHGRRALQPVRRLIEEARAPAWTRSALEDRFQALCREYRLPPAQTNVSVLGHEVDVHHHRAAFEHDRARDAAMHAAGYRVIRITHRRLERKPEQVAIEIRQLLAAERFA